MKKAFSIYTSFLPEKKPIFLSLFLTLLQTASLLPIAIIVEHLFDYILPENNLQKLTWSLLVVFLLFVLNLFAVLVNRHIILKVVKSTVGKLREKLLKQSMFFGRAFYTNEDLDIVHSRIVEDTERVDCMTNALLTQFIPGFLITVGLGILLAYMNLFLFLSLIVFLPILYASGKILGKHVEKRVEKFHNDFSTWSKGVLFILKFNELIRFGTAEESELKRQNTLIENLRISSGKMAWLSTAYTTIQSNILVFGGIFVLLVGSFQVINQMTSLGSLISFYIGLNFLSSNLKTMITAIPELIEGKESLKSLSPLLSKNLSESTQGISPKIFVESIKFKNVNFDYGNEFKLQNIDFKVSKQEIIALFGASGSGKSTIINLFMGFLKPIQGEIFIDNQNLADLNIFEHRKRIGILPQEPMFFPGTIYENLVYGLDSVNKDTVIEMCRRCKIHDFISELPNSYDADIGNRGIKISGGQKQRIAIARALLRKPEILILDEPDNNLDETLTFEIIDNIKNMKLTMIIISHNRELLAHVDRALLLKDGSIYEEK